MTKAVLFREKPVVDDLFSKGNLVEVKSEFVSDGQGYVLVVTGLSQGNSFAGTVVYSENSNWQFADHSTDFAKHCFQQYRGGVTLEV